MEKALVIGATGGIGSAVARELAARGVEVTPLSRTDHGMDLTDEESVRTCLAAIEGPVDLIFVATGALSISGREPEKSLGAVEPEALLAQFRLNAMGPLLVLKHSVRLMARDRRCVFAALSARVGSIGDNAIGGWYSYRTAKTALKSAAAHGGHRVASDAQAGCVRCTSSRHCRHRSDGRICRAAPHRVARRGRAEPSRRRRRSDPRP